MRYVLLIAALLGACARRAEVDEIREQVASLRADVEALKRLQPSAPTRAPVAPIGAGAQDVSELAIRFVQRVRKDPVAISRAAGLKLDEVIDENGLVFDPEKIATGIRAKTIRAYGKATAQRAIVDYFGPEVGNAIFFEKIKNPK